MAASPPKDRPVVEAALESGEIIVDILMRGDSLADIPLIGTAIKICKAADSIRDRAFAIKLSRFVQNLDSLTKEQQEKLKEKMNARTEEAKKVGEALFFVLERVSDLDKPLLLSQMFFAYIDGVISGEELRRLCQAIDIAFADDIQHLLSADNISALATEPWTLNLVPSGLTKLVATGAIGNMGTLYCTIAPLGQTLKKAFSHVLTSSPTPSQLFR